MISRVKANFPFGFHNFHLSRSFPPGGRFQKPSQSESGMSEQLHTGLFDCMSDLGSCMAVLLCGWTCIPSACVWAKSRNESCTFWHCAAGPGHVWARANIRKWGGGSQTHYGKDCCAYLWCCPCATCQDMRELALLKSTPQLIDGDDSVRSPSGNEAPASRSSTPQVTPSMECDPQSYQFPAPPLAGDFEYPDL
jgi:hypothetical protein